MDSSLHFLTVIITYLYHQPCRLVSPLVFASDTINPTLSASPQSATQFNLDFDWYSLPVSVPSPYMPLITAIAQADSISYARSIGHIVHNHIHKLCSSHLIDCQCYDCRQSSTFLKQRSLPRSNLCICLMYPTPNAEPCKCGVLNISLRVRIIIF